MYIKYGKSESLRSQTNCYSHGNRRESSRRFRLVTTHLTGPVPGDPTSVTAAGFSGYQRSDEISMCYLQIACDERPSSFGDTNCTPFCASLYAKSSERAPTFDDAPARRGLICSVGNAALICRGPTPAPIIECAVNLVTA
jgi:hypothetical protein